MGLLDILNTIQTTSGGPSEPRTRPAPANQGQSMSPIAKALLALLAMYAVKNVRRQDAPPMQPDARPGGTITAGKPGGSLDDLLGSVLGGGKGGSAGGSGGLGDLLRGPLGGALGGAAAGTVVSGGLGELLKQLQQAGQGNTARSWISSGPNEEISEDGLASALGTDTLDTLANQSGMPRDDLLAGLSRYLPGFVDQLTPQGRLPTEEEAGRMI